MMRSIYEFLMRILCQSECALASGFNAPYVRIYRGQLRRKLEADPTQPRYLLTEAGAGYRLAGGE